MQTICPIIGFPFHTPIDQNKSYFFAIQSQFWLPTCIIFELFQEKPHSHCGAALAQLALRWHPSNDCVDRSPRRSRYQRSASTGKPGVGFDVWLSPSQSAPLGTIGFLGCPIFRQNHINGSWWDMDMIYLYIYICGYTTDITTSCHSILMTKHPHWCILHAPIPAILKVDSAKVRMVFLGGKILLRYIKIDEN